MNEMRMNFAALGIQAIEALELVDSTSKDIEAATDALNRAKQGCTHSRELVVAFVQGAAYSLQEFRLIVEDLRRADLRKPASIGQILDKAEAVANTIKAIEAEENLVTRLHNLIAEIRAFR